MLVFAGLSKNDQRNDRVADALFLLTETPTGNKFLFLSSKQDFTVKNLQSRCIKTTATTKKKNYNIAEQGKDPVKGTINGRIQETGE